MPERDQLDVDVLIVGGGPAGLAAAIKLRQLAAARGKDDLSVMLIEKGGDVGAHGISGAVVDPKGLDELLPDWRDSAPLEAPVGTDELWWLRDARRKVRLPAPLVPPMMKNAGKYVASLQKLTKWLGEIAEQNGADVFAAFPGQELLWDGERVDRRTRRRQGRRPQRSTEVELRAGARFAREGRRSCRRRSRHAR